LKLIGHGILEYPAGAEQTQGIYGSSDFFDDIMTSNYNLQSESHQRQQLATTEYRAGTADAEQIASCMLCNCQQPD